MSKIIGLALLALFLLGGCDQSDQAERNKYWTWYYDNRDHCRAMKGGAYFPASSNVTIGGVIETPSHFDCYVGPSIMFSSDYEIFHK